MIVMVIKFKVSILSIYLGIICNKLPRCFFWLVFILEHFFIKTLALDNKSSKVKRLCKLEVKSVVVPFLSYIYCWVGVLYKCKCKCFLFTSLQVDAKSTITWLIIKYRVFSGSHWAHLFYVDLQMHKNASSLLVFLFAL